MVPPSLVSPIWMVHLCLCMSKKRHSFLVPPAYTGARPNLWRESPASYLCLDLVYGHPSRGAWICSLDRNPSKPFGRSHHAYSDGSCEIRGLCRVHAPGKTIHGHDHDHGRVDPGLLVRAHGSVRREVALCVFDS